MHTFRISLGQFVRQKSAFKVVFTKKKRKNYKLRALNRIIRPTKTLLRSLPVCCNYNHFYK